MTFIQITNQWEEDSKSNRFLSQPQQPASHGNHFIQKIIEFINSLAVIISLWCIFDINVLLILYSSLFQWIDEHKISNKAVPIQNEPKIMEWDNIDYLIKNTVDEEPSLSIRQRAKKTGIPKSTIYIRLTNYLGYASKHLKWFPICFLIWKSKI